MSEYSGSYPTSRYILRDLSKTASLNSPEKDYLLETFNTDNKSAMT